MKINQLLWFSVYDFSKYYKLRLWMQLSFNIFISYFFLKQYIPRLARYARTDDFSLTADFTKTTSPSTWQARVYWIWNERNTRLHGNTFRSADQIFKLLDRQLRNKIQSFRESDPNRCSTMMQSWIRIEWLPSTTRFFFKHDDLSSLPRGHSTWASYYLGLTIVILCMSLLEKTKVF